MEDLSCAIEECAVWVVRVRALAPNVVKGRVQEAPTEKRERIRVSLQPSKQRELLLLPEGMRNQGAVTIFAGKGVDFVTVDVVAGRIADRIEAEGVTYQIQVVNDWRALAGYVQAIAVRMGQ